MSMALETSDRFTPFLNCMPRTLGCCRSHLEQRSASLDSNVQSMEQGDLFRRLFFYNFFWLLFLPDACQCCHWLSLYEHHIFLVKLGEQRTWLWKHKSPKHSETKKLDTAQLTKVETECDARETTDQLLALSPARRVQWMRDCCPAPIPITCQNTKQHKVLHTFPCTYKSMTSSQNMAMWVWEMKWVYPYIFVSALGSYEMRCHK